MSILSWYGVDWPEDAIENFLERFIAVVGVLSLILRSFVGAYPLGMSIPVWFKEDMVGNTEAWELDVVEELKVEGKKNLFAIFPIGAAIQDSGKRKRSNIYWYTYISMNTYCYIIYYILLEMVWWVISNTSLIMQIHLVIHEILANKDFTVTDDLIS